MVATKKRSSASCSLSTITDKTTPSNIERRKNAPFFHLCYTDLCKLRSIAPNTGVKSRSGKYMLDVSGDRLKIDDWAPIIEALRHDRSLHFIAFRSKYPDKTVLENADTEVKARAIQRRPVLLTKFILQLLLESLAECLSESTSVTCIELDGLPLSSEYMSIVCKGIPSNTSLQTISFCNSHIGDEGCSQLCFLVRNMPSVLHLDLSNCDLHVESAVAIAETLKYQALQRFAESWKQSLRYREPNIETMPGLRRIILNNNVGLTDEGVQIIAEVLKEDFWIRAIDLQNCGISNQGAESILETLDINNTLCIVDVRDNRDIEDSLIHKIMFKLYHNNANKEAHEYNWIIPRSQLKLTPSNATLRSRPSIFMKRNASLKSVPSMGQQSANQRTMSQCTLKKDVLPDKKKLTQVLIQLQRNATSTSRSSTVLKQIQSDGLSSAGCASQLRDTIERFKRTVPQKSPAPLSIHSATKNNKDNSRANENTLHSKDQSDEDGYCLMKQETYNAVFETLGRFYTFIEHLKETRKGKNQDKVRKIHSNEVETTSLSQTQLNRKLAELSQLTQDVLKSTERKNEIQNLTTKDNFCIQKHCCGDTCA